MKKDTLTLNAAYRTWSAGADLRSRRRRNMRYTYGDQWSDTTTDATGARMSEAEAATRAGISPTTNNLIRPLVKSIVGRYRTDHISQYADQPVASANLLPELDSRILEEYLISGCAVQRIASEERRGRKSVWVDNVSPDAFFVNSHSDPRGFDVDIVGMLHSMTMPEVLNRFARGDLKRAAEISRIYAPSAAVAPLSACAPTLGRGMAEMQTQFASAPDARCRVIEVWTLDAAETLTCHDPERGELYRIDATRKAELDEQNSTRAAEGREPIDASWSMEMKWRCRWLSPEGFVLDEHDSPLPGGSHPFVFKLYPLTDGAVHPFVEDVIGQQRSINRLVTMIERMVSTSAKGVLLFPVRQLVEGMSWEDVASRWTACDGVIPITGIGGELPQQIVTNTSQAGATSILSLQMQLFREISGVSNALLGKDVPAATGTALYDSQVANSVTALADIFDSFGAFIAARDAIIDSATHQIEKMNN